MFLNFLVYFHYFYFLLAIKNGKEFENFLLAHIEIKYGKEFETFLLAHIEIKYGKEFETFYKCNSFLHV